MRSSTGTQTATPDLQSNLHHEHRTIESISEHILGKLRNVKQEGQGWIASCPCPGHGKGNGDLHPSFQLWTATNKEGRRYLAMKCYAGCDKNQILDALGIQWHDLYESTQLPQTRRFKPARRSVPLSKQIAKMYHKNAPYENLLDRHKATIRAALETRAWERTDSALPPKDAPKKESPQKQAEWADKGCTLANYAEMKRLPVDHLEAMGLIDHRYYKKPAIRFSYFDEYRKETAVRYRLNLVKTEHKDNRFVWQKGAKIGLYGREQTIPPGGLVFVVEGESDVHTMRYCDYIAFGVPGANNWKDERDAPVLESAELIVAVVEPDKAGENLRNKLARSRLAEKILFISLPCKDASALWIANPSKEAFRQAIDTALSQVIPATVIRDQLLAQEKAEAEAEAYAQAAKDWELCKQLATQPDILAALGKDGERAGLVGEQIALRLIYLAQVSRVMNEPISVVMLGTSSAGKSNVVKKALAFQPDDAIRDLTSASEKSLYYMERDAVKNRHIVFYELAGVTAGKKDDEHGHLEMALRTLLSEGKLKYQFPERDPDSGQMTLCEKEVDGPVGLITTTTGTLHAENRTRVLEVTVDESAEQTAAILKAIGRAWATSDRAPVDYTSWHALSRWLASPAASHEVVIPYAEQIADKIDPCAVRLRRDFGKVCQCIAAHAILHQVNRKKDTQGRVIATLDDYAAIRDLLNPSLAQAISKGISPMTRYIIETALNLMTDKEGKRTKPTTRAMIRKETRLDKSLVARHVKIGLEEGFLSAEDQRTVNLIEGGIPLPDEGATYVLPPVEAIKPPDPEASPADDDSVQSESFDSLDLDSDDTLFSINSIDSIPDIEMIEMIETIEINESNESNISTDSSESDESKCTDTVKPPAGKESSRYEF